MTLCVILLFCERSGMDYLVDINPENEAKLHSQSNCEKAVPVHESAYIQLQNSRSQP